jgi:hypothetical protein
MADYMLTGGVSYDEPQEGKIKNLARYLLPEKMENWLLGSKADEEFLNKYADGSLPTYEEIQENAKNGTYTPEDVKLYTGLRNRYDNLSADKEYRDVRNKNIEQGAWDIGSSFIPVGAGATATKLGVNILKPYLGKKLGSMVAQGAIGGAIGGGVHGLGTGFIQDDVNPLQQMATEATLGGLVGGGLGYGLGRSAKFLKGRKIANNPEAQAQYFDNYVNGLSNNSKLGELSRQSKEMNDFRRLSQGADNSGSAGLLDSSNPKHIEQFKIIKNTNPAPDDYHTWIRSADDIYDFEDTLKQDDWAEYWQDGINPDYTGDMINKALKDKKITVFSSYPIATGEFVTPSRLEALSYSGNGKVYSKEVPLSDVAWIDPTQGQYAPSKLSNLYDKIVSEPLKYTGGKFKYDDFKYKQNELPRSNKNR